MKNVSFFTTKPSRLSRYQLASTEAERDQLKIESPLSNHYNLEVKQEKVSYTELNANLSHANKQNVILSLISHPSEIEILEEIGHETQWTIYAANCDELFLSDDWKSNHVHFLESLSQSVKKQWMLKASIFLCFSLRPKALDWSLEAASSNCALVLGEHNINHEYWGDSAYYFRQRTSLLYILKTLTDTPRLCQLMGHLAQAQARRIRSLSLSFNAD